MIRLTVLLVLNLQLFAVAAPNLNEQIAQLVDQLDTDDFRAREAAQKALSELAKKNPEAAKLIRAIKSPADKPEQAMRLAQLKANIRLHAITFEKPQFEGVRQVKGARGSAGRFDANTPQIQLAANTMRKLPMTITLWFRSERDKASQMLLTDYVPCSNDRAGLSINLYGTEANGAFGMGVIMGGKNHFPVKGNMSDGKWHHVGLVMADTGTTVFFDGEQKDQFAETYLKPKNLPLHLGRMQTRCNTGDLSILIGDLDEITFHGRGLTADQIKAEYNGGPAK